MKKRTILSSIAFAIALGFGLQTNALAAESSVNVDHSATASEAVSDAWITTKIKTDLAATKNLKSGDISVETNNGVATLTGTVPSEIEVKKAVATAKSVKGVQKVDAAGLKVKEPAKPMNNLTIPSGEQQPTMPMQPPAGEAK
ncbi:MAG: BON domain-containing protein [Castellaniella sp.]|nr:BON domain-containing protein [Castellaniella sp.]